MTSKSAPRDSRGDICCKLPPEVIGLILSHLDDEERCRIIPPLCKEMYRIHGEYPPLTQRWRIDWGEGTLSQAMVKWCSTIAPSLEKLKVDLAVDSLGLMPQMLMAAHDASKLRKVCIANVGDSTIALLRSLIFLKPLTILKLAFGKLKAPGPGDVAGIRLFSRLYSLQELTFDCLDLRHSTAEQGDALWESLASLRKLKSVSFHVSDICESWGVDHDLCHPFFLRSLSLMTNISSLLLYNVYDCLDSKGLLPASLYTLTQLTELSIFGGLSSHSVRYAVSLPRLRELNLMIGEWHSQPVPFSLSSDGLTKLHLFGPRGVCSVEPLLRSSRLSLQRLRSLNLSHSLVQTFPDELASNLTNITYLALRGNHIVRLPPRLAYMKNLIEIDLQVNKSLSFEASDLRVFVALENLRVLEIDQSAMNANPEFMLALQQQAGLFVRSGKY